MSHFALLVLTNGQPTDQDLEDILMPWHKFECTGYDNQYVKDIDETEKLRQQYESASKTVLRGPDGTLHSPYEDDFYRDPTPEEQAKIGIGIGGSGYSDGIFYSSHDWGDGKGYRPKVRFIPDLFEKVEVKTRDIVSFRQWIEDDTGRTAIPEHKKPDLKDKHKYGYTVVDKDDAVVRCIDRTNPDAKWDWWRIGGRYSGKLSTYEPQKDPANFQTCFLCGGTGMRNDKLGIEARTADPSYTCNVCSGTGKDLKPASEWRYVEGSNQAPLDALNWNELKQTQVANRLKCWSELKAHYQKYSKASRTFDEARRLWVGLVGQAKLLQESGDERPLYKIIDDDPDAKDLRHAGGDFMYGIPDDVLDPEAWAQDAIPLSGFALVKDGKWYERGEMGWWGIVSDEKDKSAWDAELEALLKNAEPGTWITVVNCHI